MSEQETIYCANGLCEDEAHYRTASGMPLCYTCHQAYELGQANHSEAPAVELDQVARPYVSPVHLGFQHSEDCHLDAGHHGTCEGARLRAEAEEEDDAHSHDHAAHETVFPDLSTIHDALSIDRDVHQEFGD